MNETTTNCESWTAEIARDGAAIVPSLLAADFANLEREVRRLEAGGAKVLHVDVMDGRLVPNISVGVPVVASLRKVVDLKLDVHLMIAEPEKYLEAFRNAGADSLTIHVEAAPDPTPLLRRIRELGAAPGLALDLGTPVERILPFVDEADILLTMSVRAGFGGQKFCPQALDVVRKLRAVARPDVALEIDGGIDPTTIGLAAEAGANMFVAGTGVFRADDYGERIAFLRRNAIEARNVGR